MRLGEILIRQGLVTAAQVDEALEQQRATQPRRRIGEILIDRGWVSELQVLKALGEQFGMTVISEIDAATFDSSLVASLPLDWARTHALLPIREGRTPTVVAADPTRLSDMDDLALILGTELKPVLAPRDVILKSIEQCYYQQPGTSRNRADPRGQGDAPDLVMTRADDLLRASHEAPVTQLVNSILLDAVKQRASDVHVEPFEQQVLVRYRIDGLLYAQPPLAKTMEAGLISRLKVMARLDIAEKRLPQDGMARVRVGEREIDIRVSTVPVAEGERVVLRLLNKDSALLPLTDLGMPAVLLEKFRALLREPNGIILVTGPTGSGKTTTLYAALQQLDTARINVMTIEDPIEYQLSGIGQIQVKPKIGLTFSSGLRHILRQDPDVIFVGEIRDLETAEIAVRAALTGHLVFSTLHTNDAASAVVRLTDMGMPSYLLSAAVRGVLAQRLVRSLCPACRDMREATRDEVAFFSEAGRRLAGRPAGVPRGCSQCLGGYLGRTGLYELMVIGGPLQEAVRTGATSAQLARMAAEAVMRTLMDEGLDLALAGRTSLAEIQRAVGHG
jgi:general secretion pathway protein E